jgi:hypothetical protein
VNALLGFVDTTSPFFAWIIASVGGALLFLVLMRRRKEEEEESGGSFALAAAAVAAGSIPDPVHPPIATAPPPAPKPAAVSAKARPAKADAPAAEAPKPAAKGKGGKSSADGKSNGKRGAKVAVAAKLAAPEPVAPAATVGVASWAASDLTRPEPKTSSGPQTFSKPPGKGVERLKVGYRMVRLSEGVDDVSSRELGRLDRGDEVEVVGSYEGFLQVKTPDGLTGWIPRHTILG